MKNQFEVFYKYLGWHCWSLGIHIDVLGPRIEIHIPSGWIRIGWSRQGGRKLNGWNDGLYQLVGSREN